MEQKRARLSEGEFVLSAADVEKYALRVLVDLHWRVGK